MANRPAFFVNLNSAEHIKTKNFDFEWYAGFSINQKRKSIQSLHESILYKYPKLKILEVSTKSENELGEKLSAFNLMIHGKNNLAISVESAFQGSKVFEYGGPFTDIYTKSSKEAKKDPRIRNSGEIIAFKFFSREFELEPKTFFYDWLYINALCLYPNLIQQVLEYDAFTDIEFNPEKSINCQAKSLALFVSLYKKGLLYETIKSKDAFKKAISISSDLTNYDITQQLTLDDENLS